MKYIVSPSSLSGAIDIPGSKSHTIRALVFGLLADGTSIIRQPLVSSDTQSCLDMVRTFGGQITMDQGRWKIIGTAGRPQLAEDIVDVGNSGTTLYIGMAIAALIEGYTVFTGDHQIRNRPADALLKAITDLGGQALSTRQNGKPPLVIKGKIRGGKTSIEAVTSQYLTALLIAAPLAENDTVITVPLLYEAPYVLMTNSWLRRLGIAFTEESLKRFIVKGGQCYSPFDEYIPADFSSATFFLVAAAITGSIITLRGLDYSDTQGDKGVVDILRDMGADIEIGDRQITIQGKGLRGGRFDLNAMPDALPALAVAACHAEGTTELFNVPQARLKETDRIAVMAAELTKMGASVQERPDGLIITGGKLYGAAVCGHHDHRVVMALAVAGLAAKGDTVIDTAEAVGVTFPEFSALLASLGGAISSTNN